MEGLGLVANCLAVASITLQLSESCIKLYTFWESIEDAPHEIAVIKEDLRYLISVFKRIESAEQPLGPSIIEGVRHCRIKVAALTLIVEKFDCGFRSMSKRKRLCTAFKVAAHSKHVQRFRDSLNETIATLTLAMTHECFAKSSTLHTVASHLSRSMPSRIMVSRAQQITRNTEVSSSPTQTQVDTSPSRTSQHFLCRLPAESDDLERRALVQFEKELPEQSLATLTIQELMLHAISQTAIATFQSSSLDIFAQDGYMMDNCGQIRSRTFVYSENIRYRIRHQATGFRTALGCLWVRRTTIGHADEVDEEPKNIQTVTSIVFYPVRWLQLLGLRNGLEALIASSGRSCLYNCKLSITRAVPRDSMIFQLCSAGECKAVNMLLESGQASLVDTSPEGWKPLHFAAVSGHVELCAMLIRAGADKSALVYEGPTESVLSPISLFVSQCSDKTAEEKIAMLRLFCDCIDLSEAGSEGWLVHEWLKKAYAKERGPISANSITWLLHLTANEEYVEFSARSVWSGLQHAVRSVLTHGRLSNILARVLGTSTGNYGRSSQRRVEALCTWLSLRVSGRILLPMLISAGSFLQMQGFDWINDDLSQQQYMQALPNIYAAWCHAVLDAVEQAEKYLREELEQCLDQMGLTREAFSEAISCPSTTLVDHNHRYHLPETVCTDCGEDYMLLNDGLVEPARIAVNECVVTGHDFGCRCRNVEGASIYTTQHQSHAYRGACYDSRYAEDSDDDEEFFDAEPYPIDTNKATAASVFTDIGTLLYRAHGRVWLGTYSFGERLCGTCFLLREQYISEDGLAGDFPPVPKSFKGLRVKW